MHITVEKTSERKDARQGALLEKAKAAKKGLYFIHGHGEGELA
ncbi:hypothetical protein V6x_20110 [Gimesia chilikensis]|uniref:Uncharacterized protein n=1 Tax=Gimesia chilikensis TaxID=2605989 RepID=A0A517WAN8_9PLAN|nr:hypothetical protein V6x_20110 [Gimesia chilikensis]